MLGNSKAPVGSRGAIERWPAETKASALAGHGLRSGSVQVRLQQHPELPPCLPNLAEIADPLGGRGSGVGVCLKLRDPLRVGVGPEGNPAIRDWDCLKVIHREKIRAARTDRDRPLSGEE